MDRRRALDVTLALAVAVVALAVHLDGSESVAANRAPDVASVLLTLLATAPVVARRDRPLSVLGVTALACLGLVVTREAVGLSTLGPLVASYAATAYSDQARTALGVIAATVAATAALRPVDLSPEGALVTVGALAFAVVLGTSTRARRQRHEAELEAAERRAELEHQHAEQVAVEERLRLVRELHDVIGHAMSVMVVQAGAAERLLATSPEQARDAVTTIGRTGRESMQEMRRLLGVLRSDDGQSAARAPAPGLSDVPALVERVRAAGLDVELRGEATDRELPAGLDLAAYRVVQEALTNCLQHSTAQHAWVRLHVGSEAVEVEVTDDGRLDGPVVPGHGLTGMRERVGVYGGSLAAAPRPGGGFGVRARFVLP